MVAWSSFGSKAETGQRKKNDEFFRKFFLWENIITCCTKSLRRFTRLPPNILTPQNRDYISTTSHLIFPHLDPCDRIFGILPSILALLLKLKKQRLMDSGLKT